MRSRSLPGLAGLLVVTVLVLAGCSGSDSDSSATDTAPTTPSAADTSCTYTADGSTAAKKVDPPPSTASETGQVPVTIATSVGDLEAELDADTTPCTVNSFVSLAKQGYFDDTPCHRLTTSETGIFVLQCGDPSGTGTGGPGYSYPDELSGSETYPAGTLAMANAGPDTNGSQFFIVYDDTPLPAKYTVFGQVDDASLKIVEGVAAKGTSTGQPDGPPKQAVQITKVTVAD